MKISVFTIFLFLVSGGMHAQEEVLLTRQAEAHFQAGEYDQAIRLFEKLEDEKFQSWQQERLHYNIGTILLQERHLDEALTTYAQIPFAPHAAPLLGRALKTNIAVLLFRKAILLTRQENLTLDDYSKAFFLYRETLRNIGDAEHAECSLQAVIGKKYCKPSTDLNELRAAAKINLAIITKKFGEAKIAESPTKEGVPLLLSGVNLALSHVRFLESKKLNDKLKKSYLKHFARDAESWLSLWESQMEKIVELEEAYKYYLDGLTDLQRDQLDESRIAFLSSEASLAKLMKTLWGTDSLFERLQMILTSYQRTLDQSPVQTSSLYQLQAEQSQIDEALEIGDPSKQKLDQSSTFLKKSLDYAQQGKSAHARFFLEEAGQWMRRLLRQKTPAKENTPIATLEEAIEEQMHALTLHRLSREMGEENKDTRAILRDSQEAALTVASPFLQEVMDKEAREYPNQCQCKPWDSVIPLFDKGRLAAEKALDILQKNQRIVFAMPLQEETMKYWKEALENMKNPKKHHPPPPPEAGTSTQDVLRFILQMDSEDRLPQPEKSAAKKGNRPW